MRAFGECAGLTDVVIPVGVTSIGVGAFGDCAGLTEITIPNGVTRIEDNVFIYCSSLRSVAIPDSVTSIGHGAFADCASLTGVILPDNLESIEDAAFYGCVALTDITIPRGVTSLGSLAFEGCGLSAFAVAEKNPAYKAVDGILFNKAGTELLRYPAQKGGDKYVIPDSVTSIGPGAFMECGGLTEIMLPDDLKSIGDGAFTFCGGLTAVTIPDGVMSIGGSAFQDCGSLTEVTLPRRVASIGDMAFCECGSLTSVTILNPAMEFPDSYWVFGFPSPATIYGYTGSTAETYCKTYGVTFTSLGEAPDPVKALTDSMVSLPEGYAATYDETAHTPAVMVKDGETALILDTDYTVAYENNINAGEAAVAVTGKGNYEGIVTRTFTIHPAAPDVPPDEPDPPASSGSSVPSTARRTISVTETVNGAVSLSTKKAGRGETVTVTVKPEEGYQLESLTVTDRNKKAVTLTNIGGGKYTFVMPGATVTVTPVFVKGSAPAEPPKEAQPETPPETKLEASVTERFGDVKESDWFRGAVQYVFDKGMMTGLTEDAFGPGVHTSRAMVVTILHRLAGEPTAALAGFSDVKENDDYRNAVSWAVANGIVKGFEDNTFRPGNDVTREQLAVMLYRYGSYQGQDMTARAEFSAYSDVEQIGAYALDAMSWAKAEGLISGTDWGGLHSGGSATRAETAAILMRYCERQK